MSNHFKRNNIIIMKKKQFNKYLVLDFNCDEKLKYSYIQC